MVSMTAEKDINYFLWLLLNCKAGGSNKTPVFRILNYSLSDSVFLFGEKLTEVSAEGDVCQIPGNFVHLQTVYFTPLRCMSHF